MKVLNGPSAPSPETVPNQRSRILVMQEICRCSSSGVSNPVFATAYSFCSIFQNLQELHKFAPLLQLRAAFDVAGSASTALRDLLEANEFFKMEKNIDDVRGKT